MASASSTSYNKKSSAVKRILSEARELEADGSREYCAAPLEDNIFEWHFTLRGAPGSEFEAGIYHGRILLPPEYPFRPPSLMLLTPNGRWECGKKICLTFTGFHEEQWQPAWGIRTALLGVQAFMTARREAAQGVGALDVSVPERQRMARSSIAWTCAACARRNDEILPPAPPGEQRGAEQLPHGLEVADASASTEQPTEAAQATEEIAQAPAPGAALLAATQAQLPLEAPAPHLAALAASGSAAAPDVELPAVQQVPARVPTPVAPAAPVTAALGAPGASELLPPRPLAFPRAGMSYKERAGSPAVWPSGPPPPPSPPPSSPLAARSPTPPQALRRPAAPPPAHAPLPPPPRWGEPVPATQPALLLPSAPAPPPSAAAASAPPSALRLPAAPAHASAPPPPSTAPASAAQPALRQPSAAPAPAPQPALRSAAPAAPAPAPQPFLRLPSAAPPTATLRPQRPALGPRVSTGTLRPAAAAAATHAAQAAARPAAEQRVAQLDRAIATVVLLLACMLVRRWL